MTATYVGMDIGATKCAILIDDGNGPPLSQTLPSTDWEAEPAELAAVWIDRALRSVLPKDAQVSALAVGAQGIDREQVALELEDALGTLGYRLVRCVNDASLLVPAAGLRHGLGLIAGTGAIGNGVDATGRLLLTGGWGAVIGDDAGAAGITREATKAALLAHDDGLPDDGLLAALLNAFQVDDAERLARSVNDLPTTEHWGRRASAVFAAAEAGSGLARAVITSAAEHLVRLVAQLRSRGALGTEVVAAGSVIVGQPALAGAVGDLLAEQHPDLGFRVLTSEPVSGALVLARRLQLSGRE